MKIRQNIWVVIPAYNEANYISRVLSKVLVETSQVIVVDDGSSDNTYAQALTFPVHVIRHRLNLGKGAAMKTGCEYAFSRLGADAVVMMDADDQHEASELPLFFSALGRGSQVVFGVRQEPKEMPWLRLKMNRLGSFLTYLVFGEYILDIPSGFKAFTGQAYQIIAWEAHNYAVELEIAARTAKAKLRYDYVRIKTVYHDTNKGMTMLDVIPILWYLVKLKVTL